MNKMTGKGVTRDGWDFLKKYTSARIAIGRSGGSLPTSEWLDFKLAHARARDAVHFDFDPLNFAGRIHSRGSEILMVKTLAADRMTYLQRPDLGRRLNDKSKSILSKHSGEYDLVIMVSDGLSSMAVERQTLPLLECLLPKLYSRQSKLAPIIIAPFARVALEDEVGALLNARIALILLGERPGLGSPDSLGAYLVFGPRNGNTDAQRNCVSNIRPEGLGYQAAADTLDYLLEQSRIRGISGVLLKDDRKVSEISVGGKEPAAVLPGKD
ncbi:MAG: ethanolamine ammonia-lyase subunit EutC [Methylococcaceae bacterium]|nr:ethanolamine ammonia-lyase subunit EutC [Methylococcaceae bacterium]